MTNPVWPTSLPQYVLESGYNEKTQDQMIETQMEAGPVKVRRRYTKPIVVINCSMMMTAAQAVTFETFWQVTTAGGTIKFDWVHPRTRASKTMRFRNPAPSMKPIGGDTVVVGFVIEVL